MTDYQERYEAHQSRKAETLKTIIAERHSDRRFGEGSIDVTELMAQLATCPSSCNRKGIAITIVDSRDDKALLSGLLVGGVGWIHRADRVLLLFADTKAYVAGREIEWMPYLDAGVIAGVTYLIAAANDWACCFVNPNVRPANQAFFQERFGNPETLFCGAIALGSKPQ